jgi:hypothetical protein
MMRLDSERGVAFLVAIAFVAMLTAAAGAAALNARLESLLAASFRESCEARALAHASLARAIADLSSMSDWTPPLSGAVSTFIDGSGTGPKRLPGGDVVVLCCGTDSLTEQLQQRGNGGLSWGADTPQWRLFGWGPAARWLDEGRTSPYYVVMWIADDVEDGDGDAARDSNGVLLIHAAALGRGGARRMFQAVIRRARDADGAPALRGVAVLSTFETRW